MVQRTLAVIGLSLAVVFVSVEIVTQLFPVLVPVRALIYFQPDLRGKIADRMGMRSGGSTYLLARSDNGPPLPLYKPNTVIRTRFPDAGSKNRITLDAAGFCNDVGAPIEGHVDVVAVGDSFSWCTGISADQTWPGHLQAGSGLSVYNASVQGVGLHEYVEVIEQFALKRTPKVVVMNVYGGNDFRDALRYRDHLRQTAAGVPAEDGGMPQSRALRLYFRALDNPFGRSSIALNLLSSSVSRLWVAFRETQVQVDTVNFRYNFKIGDTLVPFNRDNADTDEVEAARSLIADPAGLHLFDAPLEKFAALGKAHGFVPVLAYVPPAYIAYRAEVEFETPSVAETMFKSDDLQADYFARECARLGIGHIDSRQALAEAARADKTGLTLYFPWNRHLTSDGHAVLAKEIDSFLKSNLHNDNAKTGS